MKAGVTVFLILDLREAYVPNLSLLASLEPFEKVPVVVGSGGGGVKTYFGVQLWPRPS